MIWKFFTFSTVLFSLALQGADPHMAGVTIGKLYAPIGYDDNDRIQLTVAGIFPSTCYKVSSIAAIVNKRQKSIWLWQRAYVYSGNCVQMSVPFSQVTNIRPLGEGADGMYRVYDGLSGKQLGTLPVLSAKTGPDDFLYAPVEDAFVNVTNAGTKSLTLTGSFSDRCTVFKDVKIHYYPDVIVVQPIVERINGRCEPAKTRFAKTVDLDPALNGTYLLHVRAMNGQSINKLVDMAPIQ